MIELEISSGSDNDKYNKHHKYSKVPNKRAPRLFFLKKKKKIRPPAVIRTSRLLILGFSSLAPKKFEQYKTYLSI